MKPNVIRGRRTKALKLESLIGTVARISWVVVVVATIINNYHGEDIVIIAVEVEIGQEEKER